MISAQRADLVTAAARTFGITSVPTALLVDKTGTVQAVYVGESLEVRKLVAEHIDAVLQGGQLARPATPQN